MQGYPPLDIEVWQGTRSVQLYEPSMPELVALCQPTIFLKFAMKDAAT